MLLLVGIPSWCAAIGWNSKRKCYAIGWSTKRSCYWLLYREDVMLLVGIPSWWAAIFWNTELMWCYWLEYLVIDTECAAIGGVCAYLLVWTFTVGSYYWFKSGRSAIGWNSENMCTVHCATCISGLVINSCRVPGSCYWSELEQAGNCGLDTQKVNVQLIIKITRIVLLLAVIN